MDVKSRCSAILKSVGIESSKDNICLTPEAVYHIDISSKKRQITVTVDLPPEAVIPETEKEAIKLEDDLHDAVELALAKLFPSA